MTSNMTSAEYRALYCNGPEPENPYADIPGWKDVQSTIKTPAAKPQATEHEIQSAILEALGNLSGSFFWRENSGLLTVGQGHNTRFFRAGTPGIPDIMGVWKGRMVGIEVKRPGKKQSIDQLAFEQRLKQCGGMYILCTDAGDIIKQVKGYDANKN